MKLLSDDLWAAIKPVFERAYPHEAVVAVYRDDTWEELENNHERPWETFRISGEDSARLYARDTLVLLHSHPNRPGEAALAWPSDEDTENQLAMGITWGIVPVHGHPHAAIVVRTDYPEFWGPDAPVSPLEGRSFLWGVRDCWTLCADYYALHGHELAPIPRVKDAGPHHTDPRKVDPFRYWPSRLGFERVDRDDRQPGDLCVWCWTSPRPNHTLIYLGEGKYLHQPEKGLSKAHQIHNEETVLAQMCAEFWRLKKGDE